MRKDMVTGRPTKYNQKLADTICLLISEGQSVRQVCKLDDMPDKSQIFVWLSKYPEFQDQYAKAKRAGVESLAEELIDIADDGTNDYMEYTDKEGQTAYKVNGEAVARSRLRIDTRKWVLSKLIPKKYGEDKEENNTVSEIADALKEIAGSLPS